MIFTFPSSKGSAKKGRLLLRFCLNVRKYYYWPTCLDFWEIPEFGEWFWSPARIRQVETSFRTWLRDQARTSQGKGSALIVKRVGGPGEVRQGHFSAPRTNRRRSSKRKGKDDDQRERERVSATSFIVVESITSASTSPTSPTPTAPDFETVYYKMMDSVGGNPAALRGSVGKAIEIIVERKVSLTPSGNTVTVWPLNRQLVNRENLPHTITITNHRIQCRDCPNFKNLGTFDSYVHTLRKKDETLTKVASKMIDPNAGKKKPTHVRKRKRHPFGTIQGPNRGPKPSPHVSVRDNAV